MGAGFVTLRGAQAHRADRTVLFFRCHTNAIEVTSPGHLTPSNFLPETSYEECHGQRFWRNSQAESPSKVGDRMQIALVTATRVLTWQCVPQESRIKNSTRSPPDAIHIPTEGPLGWASRAYCIKKNCRLRRSFTQNFRKF